MFFKELIHIRHKKEILGSHYFSFFALSNLLTQTGLHFCRTGQLTSSEHAKCTYPICSSTLRAMIAVDICMCNTVLMFLNNSIVIDYGLLCYLLRMMLLRFKCFYQLCFILCFDRDLSTKFRSFMCPCME